VGIQVQRLRERLADREMTLILSDDAKAKLARDGFEPAFGARPLKRLIQQEIENPLAKAILDGHFVPGDEIVVAVKGGAFDFAKREPVVATSSEY